MSKIEKLTPEQEGRLQEFVDRWISIGTDTKPMNKGLATIAINKLYRCGGLEPPKKIIWTDSPLGNCLSLKALQNLKNNKSSIKDSVWCSIRSSVRDSVWSSVEDSVRDSVWSSVWSSVRDSVWSSVWSSVRDSVLDSVWNSVYVSVYGQHEAYSLSCYAYYKEVCGLTTQTKPLEGLFQVVKHCGWMYPTKEIAIVSEKHNICRLNNNKVIHCEDGPAIAYPDGFEIYAWNGTVVPKEWITNKEKQDPQKALTHDNIEQRRALCEILGWNKILGSVKHTILDKNPDPEIGELIQADLPDAENSRFIKVKCGTGRDFILPVPSDVSTAQEAQNWMWSLDRLDYKPEVRT